MVLTSWPSAITASVVQDLTALPSTCTTQAPHCEVSQPTWVPVRRRFSRRNCTSSVRGSTSAAAALPFTVMETWIIHPPPLNCRPRQPHRAPRTLLTLDFENLKFDRRALRNDRCAQATI